MSSTPQQSQNISIPDLRSDLNGEVIGPDDAAYDEARQVFFKGVDRRPAAVARVAGADDVARVVTLARESGARAGRPQRRPQPRGPRRPAKAGSCSTSLACAPSTSTPTRRPPGPRPGLTAGEYTNAVGERRPRHRASATPARSGSAGSPSAAASASWSGSTA